MGGKRVWDVVVVTIVMLASDELCTMIIMIFKLAKPHIPGPAQNTTLR